MDNDVPEADSGTGPREDELTREEPGSITEEEAAENSRLCDEAGLVVRRRAQDRPAVDKAL